jgi:hypothetical protein
MQVQNSCEKVQKAQKKKPRAEGAKDAEENRDRTEKARSSMLAGDYPARMHSSVGAESL